MRHVALLISSFFLISCGDGLVNKTDKSTTTITCNIWEDREKPSFEYYENNIDDDSYVSFHKEDNDVVYYRYCTDIDNRTYDGETL